MINNSIRKSFLSEGGRLNYLFGEKSTFESVIVYTNLMYLRKSFTQRILFLN